MRKHLLLAGGLAAALLLAVACGGDTGADPNRKLKLGIVVANNSLNFAREMYEGATEAAKHAGNVDFKVVGPTTTDGPAEVQLFENLTVTSPDGIIVENLAPPLFTRPEARAVGKGIPIVALDTSPTEGSKVNFYVGNDNYELGALLAKETLEKLGNDAKGLVVIGVPNPGTPVLDNRAQGIKDTFGKEAPGVKVLGPFQTYSDPAQNYNAWLAQVHAHPDALAFLGVGDADSYDLAKIKEKEHGEYLTAGFDVDPKTLQAIKKGTNFVGLDPAHFLKGYVASAVLAERVKAGKDLPEGWFKTPGIVIDQSNIDEIIQRQKSPQEAYKWYKPQIDELLKDYEGKLKPLQDAR
ncbi:sugar ABC transporter substrate-binding protein [Flindersiella endophytica]